MNNMNPELQKNIDLAKGLVHDAAIDYAAMKQAEKLFEDAFKEHMHVHIGNFKNDYRTLYQKVIIPSMARIIRKMIESQTENEDLRKGFSDVAVVLMNVKNHLINIDPYFSSPKMVEQIDQVLEKYIS